MVQWEIKNRKPTPYQSKKNKARTFRVIRPVQLEIKACFSKNNDTQVEKPEKIQNAKNK